MSSTELEVSRNRGGRKGDAAPLISEWSVPF